MSVAVALLALVLSTPGTSFADPKEEAASIDYPLTIRKIWYRNAKRSGFTGAKHSGDLTIDRQSLEFFAKKRSLSIPLDELWMITYGTMRGDVDTEWVVLTIKDGDERSLVGLRDGSRWGYGQRTREIYETLVAAAEDLSAAQFSAPDGYQPYSELDHVFAMPIPADWSYHHHDLITHEGTLKWGRVVFSEHPLIDPEVEHWTEEMGPNPQRDRAVHAIQQGEETAWIVARFEAGSGMTCEELKPKAIKTLSERVNDSPFFGVPFEPADDLPFEAAEPVDGCASVRLERRAAGEQGKTVVLDLRAVAREETVLMIGLRTTADEYERRLPVFERAVDELRLAATR
jgi:hypothetical protein